MVEILQPLSSASPQSFYGDSGSYAMGTKLSFLSDLSLPPLFCFVFCFLVLVLFCWFVWFWPRHAACGMLVPRPGIAVLTTGPPGKSLSLPTLNQSPKIYFLWLVRSWQGQCFFQTFELVANIFKSRDFL